jgi:hypothetical protein
VTVGAAVEAAVGAALGAAVAAGDGVAAVPQADTASTAAATRPKNLSLIPLLLD